MAISRAFPLAVETIDRQMAGFVETADIPEGRQAGRCVHTSVQRQLCRLLFTRKPAKCSVCVSIELMLEQFSTASSRRALITRLRYWESAIDKTLGELLF